MCTSTVFADGCFQFFHTAEDAPLLRSVTELARFTDKFVQRRDHCLLLVPSVLAPTEDNCLINPACPEYKMTANGQKASLHNPRAAVDGHLFRCYT